MGVSLRIRCKAALRVRRRSTTVVKIVGGFTERLSWLDVVEAASILPTRTQQSSVVAAVMAPALTEAGPQKPENLLIIPSSTTSSTAAEAAAAAAELTTSVSASLALPAGGFLSVKQAKQVCQNREVLAQFVVSANVQPTKIDDQCLHGIPKDLINDVINLKFDSGLNGLSDLIAVNTVSRKETSLPTTITTTARREAEEAIKSPAAAIMNDPSMGDPADDMCFFKTIMGPNGSDETDESTIADIAEQVAKGVVQQQQQQVGGIVGNINDNNTNSTFDAVKQIQEEEEDLNLEREIMCFTGGINVPTGPMDHNVDDILQVIKSMENAAESGGVLDGDNRLTDGCGDGLVEPSSQSVAEGVAEMFPDGETFPLNLLNDVDVMGLCTDKLDLSDPGVVPIDPQPDRQQQQQHHHQLQLQRQQELQLQRAQQKLSEAEKLERLSQQQKEIERRQHDLERRTSFIMRRLRKIQCRVVGEHVAEEATHVLELAQQSAKKCFYQDLAANLGPKAGNTRNFPELAGSLSSFLQKVQKSCNAQSNSIALRQRNQCRYFGAGSKDNYTTNQSANRIPVFGVPQIKLNREEIEKVAGPLATKLKILQNAYDSDCTASSSGGESCDEMQTFNNPTQQQLPIVKRAGWRYAQERASVASRWTWLQAQISDLEYKIRQHNELQRQIRAAKGLIILEADTTSTATTTNQLHQLHRHHHHHHHHHLHHHQSPTVNGYSGLLPGTRGGIATATGCEIGNAGGGCSRTRPLACTIYRKRKLVQIDGLHEISKKAARPATISCNCEVATTTSNSGSNGLLAPCAVCTGRRKQPIGQEQLELLSVSERIAMVDPGFHPVLSMTDEVTHTVHTDAIMRSTEWQQKMLRGSMRVSRLKDKDGNERRSRKTSEHHTKYPARAKKSQTTLMGARMKRKVLKDKRSRSNSERSNHGRSKRSSKHQHHQSSQQSQYLHNQQYSMDDEGEASALSSSSKYSSPVPSPLQQHHQHHHLGSNTNCSATITSSSSLHPPEKNTLREKSSNSHSHSRLRQDSYDIDNIVIPYSVAASARLEKLPYKEIQIPKWRLCYDDPTNTDVKNGAVQKPLSDNEDEDVTDETIVLRHERSEKEETKRFMSFANFPHHSRIRHSRRTDSRTDSGANTPDPLSPHASDFGGDTMSPITSPPATPSSNVHDGEHSQQQTETHHRSGSLQNALRRRTLSTSARSQNNEATSSVIEEEHEQVLPYEPRSFPLADEDYEKMLEVMPGGHLQPLAMSSYEDKIDEGDIDSQESDSTESALCDMDEGEDPNDPEWTVAEELGDTEKERIRPTAKR